MNITFELFDPLKSDHIDTLFRWETDEEIFKLITPIFKQEDQNKLADRKVFASKYLKTGDYIHEIQFICVDNKPVGNFSLMMDPGHLYKKIKGTAWLGLTIAEREYWGKGIAKIGMEKCEERALFHGANRIELGVFEFNSRAISFYKKIGYQEIGRIEEFTWADDKKWDDIRMEKILLDEN